MKVNFFESSSTEVPLYETDNQKIFLKRVAFQRGVPPESIILPIDFNWFSFLKKPHQFLFLDLLSILPEKPKEALILFQKVNKNYLPTSQITNRKKSKQGPCGSSAPVESEIITTESFSSYGLFRFTELLLYQLSLKSKHPLNEHSKKSLNIFFQFDWITLFKEKLKTDLANWFSNTSVATIISRLDLQKDRNENEVSENEAENQVFQQITPLNIEKEEIIGYIQKFLLPTELTTGKLFDRFQTTAYFPLARYKSFYKIHNPSSLKEDSEINQQNYYSDLRVYNKEGDVNIHFKTVETGILCQCLLIQNSDYPNLHSLLKMFQLEDIKPLHMEKFGQRSQFYIQDQCLDPSIFSDMILNNIIFQQFLTVNDTDKIFRQNKSVYVYFKDNQIKSPLQSSDIWVGGWNRAFSRYGDLTAILQCEANEDKKFSILVRVVRSLDQNILNSFKQKIAKLIPLYVKNLPGYLKLYHTLLPNFVQDQPSIVVGKTKDDALERLKKAEPSIFLSNIYGRNCQKVKPVILEDPQVIKSLPSDRKILFPPLEYKGIKPRYYTCPTEPYADGEKYLYPGLKSIKQSENPFGYYPCCYIETKGEKNEKITKKLESKILGDKVATTTTLLQTKKNIDHVIKMPKIIDSLGQMGILPENLEIFFLMENPTAEYYRLGMPLENSFLHCLEYQDAMKNQRPMRLVMDIKMDILKTVNLNIGLEENYDIGIEGIENLLKGNESLQPERFFRIMENYYKIVLFVFLRDKSDQISLLTPKNIRSWYRLQNTTRPIVAIYQHYGGTMDNLVKMESGHCELIITKFFTNKKSYTFSQSKTLWSILEHSCIRQYDLGKRVLPALLDDGKLSKFISGQQIDSLGKCRILFFHSSFIPGFFIEPMAPLAIQQIQDYNFPTFDHLSTFFIQSNIQPHRTVSYDTIANHLFCYVSMGNKSLIFPSVVKDWKSVLATTVKKEKIPPPEIGMIILPLSEQEEVSNMRQKIRMSSIIQDYCLYGFSHFMVQQKDILKDRPLEDCIQLFMDRGTKNVSEFHIYPAIDDVPLTFSDSVPGLVEKKRILLAPPVKEKLKYFLKWFQIRREEELEKYQHMREIPSFFQYTCDFESNKNQIIINTLQKIKPIETYHYETKSPLDLEVDFDVPFYYHNSQVTGKNMFLAVRVRRQNKAIALLAFWKKEQRLVSNPDENNISNVVFDVPTSSKNYEWSQLPNSIGRMTPGKNNSWIVFFELKN